MRDEDVWFEHIMAATDRPCGCEVCNRARKMFAIKLAAANLPPCPYWHEMELKASNEDENLPKSSPCGKCKECVEANEFADAERSPMQEAP